MSSRLLLVEPSTTMRFVLDNFVQSQGYTVVSVGDYNEAVESLRDQFQSFDNDFDAVILGWPSVAVREADNLTALLEQDDFHGLPVVVMSTDQRAETRAWVADRPNSAMLAWKSYESIDEILNGMVKPSKLDNASEDQEDSEKAPLKFDNSDIGVLLIDDSPSIRESLTNVLTLHGYRIQSVASGKEALEVFKEHPIDIAIVDFYLTEETGDEVVRSIMNTAPNTVCAILTSAYSDPIIKLSLRAGAVDCFFKNEAGELLLARIDALARVVRQRKALAVEQKRLDRLVDTLAGATLLINDDDQLTYVSDQAAKQLGFSDRRELAGQSISALVDPETIRQAGTGRHESQWVKENQETIDVVYRLIPIPGTSERMVAFKPASSASPSLKPSAMAAVAAVVSNDGAAENVNVDASSSIASNGSSTSSTEDAIIIDADVNTDVAADANKGSNTGNAESEPSAITESDDLKRAANFPATQGLPSIDSAADPFLHQLVEYIKSPETAIDPVSLLIIGVMFKYHDGTIIPAADDAELNASVSESVLAIYRRENHVAQLAGHRYGFILRHTDTPQSYLLTRKIMQMCNNTELPEHFVGKGQLCVNGCLVGLAQNPDIAAHDMLTRAIGGLRAVDVRGVNQALLLDLKRMLPVYPAS